MKLQFIDFYYSLHSSLYENTYTANIAFFFFLRILGGGEYFSA